MGTIPFFPASLTHSHHPSSNSRTTFSLSPTVTPSSSGIDGVYWDETVAIIPDAVCLRSAAIFPYVTVVCGVTGGGGAGRSGFSRKGRREAGRPLALLLSSGSGAEIQRESALRWRRLSARLRMMYMTRKPRKKKAAMAAMVMPAMAPEDRPWLSSVVPTAEAGAEDEAAAEEEVREDGVEGWVVKVGEDEDEVVVATEVIGMAEDDSVVRTSEEELVVSIGSVDVVTGVSDDSVVAGGADSVVGASAEVAGACVSVGDVS